MTMTTEPTYPVPLRDFLADGGDVAAVLGKISEIGLVDDMLEVALGRNAMPDKSLLYRTMARQVVEDVRLLPIPRGESPREGIRIATEPGGTGWQSLQQYVTSLSWSADLLENPDLVDALLEQMPSEDVMNFEATLESYKHPHRLLLETAPDPSMCSACGESVAGQVIRAPDDEELRYCFGCVAMAYEAMKAAQSG